MHKEGHETLPPFLVEDMHAVISLKVNVLLWCACKQKRKVWHGTSLCIVANTICTNKMNAE